MPNQYDTIQKDATLGGSEDDPAGSVSEIESYVQGNISSWSNFVTDPGDIPETASSRQNGVFKSDTDLFEYLSKGGLIGWEEVSPGEWEARPIGWVYVLRVEDENDPDDFWYHVWIDDDTDPV